MVLKFISRIFGTLEKHKELSFILFMSFIFRVFLLNVNSYWLDELLSIVVRGVNLDNALGVFEYYRGHLVPHPLYELILYHWMLLFGSSEIATRFLSTIFVLLAIVILYFFSYRIFSRRIAVMTALFFSLSYLSVYYSLEARYYGLILFLSTLSSYLLYLYLHDLRGCFGWKKIMYNKYFILLWIVNTALMFSHSFTLLFIATQGLFVMAYFIYYGKPGTQPGNIFKVLSLYLIQSVLMISHWVFLFVEQLRQPLGETGSFIGQVVTAGAHSGIRIVENPFSVFFNYVIKPSLYLPAIGFAILFMLMIVSAGACIHYFFQKRKLGYKPLRRFFLIYALMMITIPCVFVSIIYLIGDYDMLRPRYLIYCNPMLMLMLALCLEQAVRLTSFLFRKARKQLLPRLYLNYKNVFAVVFASFFILPMSYAAATRKKGDWRGMAKSIVQVIRQDPDHTYAVIETCYGRGLLDFYLGRNDDSIRVTDLIMSDDEVNLAGGNFRLTAIFDKEVLNEIQSKDFLILTFTDQPATRFPILVDLFSTEYELYINMLDEKGRGIMIFSISNTQQVHFP